MKNIRNNLIFKKWVKLLLSVYKDNKVVKDIKTIKTDDEINVVIKGGTITAGVKGVNKNE